MVRILANGDIVPDDDPRVQQSTRSTRGNNVHGIHSGTNQNGGQQGQRQGWGQGGGGQGWYGGGDGAPEDGNDGQVHQVSIFEVMNQKLLSLGVPRWNFGEHVIEPIVLVGFLLAMLLFGLRGLIMGVLLFAVVKMSQGNRQNQPRRR